MGFNFGAFAGGLAQGGLNTYQQISAIQSQKKRDELVELQAQEAKNAMQERAALKEAAGVYNKVGGQDYDAELQRTAGIGADQAGRLAVNTGTGGDEFDRAVNQSAAAALLENKARADASRAGIPTDDVASPTGYGAVQGAQSKAIADKSAADAAGMKPAVYTRERADADYLAKVRGISPERALDVEAKQLQISGGKRTERYAKQQETALGFQQNVLDDLAANKGDVGAVLEKHFIPLYNQNKLPGLNDGGTAKIVDSAVGGGKSILLTDKEGKNTTMPADLKTLQMLTTKAQDLMMASATPENYWHAKDQKIKESTAAAQMKHADAAVSSAGAAWANAKTNAQMAESKNKYWNAMATKVGQTKADEMKEIVGAQADLLQKADPKLSRADAELKAANQYLKTPDAKASVVTGEQVQKFLDSEAAQSKEFLYTTDSRTGRKRRRTPEEQQIEAMRLLQLRTGGSGIPVAGGNKNAALIEANIKNITDDDFK